MGGGSSSSSTKYAVVDQEEENMSPPKRRTKTSDKVSTTTPTTLTTPTPSSTTTQINNFPDVHRDDRHNKTSNALPEWAVPKLKNYAEQHEETILSEHVYHVKATLLHVKEFTTKYQHRLTFDRVLTPRTIFSEVYLKEPAKVTDYECYLLETFVSDQQVKYDIENEAAIFVQRIWRGHHGSNVLQLLKAHKIILEDCALADRRKKYDLSVAKSIEIEGQKTMEEWVKKKRILEEEEEKKKIEQRMNESFIVRFITSGGLQKNQNTNKSTKERGRGSASNMSDKKHKLLVRTLTRIADASSLDEAWLGIKKRDYWRRWMKKIKKYNFIKNVEIWHLKKWFDAWEMIVWSRLRTERLLENIMERMYHQYVRLGFFQWWRKTRKRFRIFHSTDGISKILVQNNKFTPRSSLVITNYPNADRGMVERNEIVNNNGETLAKRLSSGRWI